MMTPHYQQARQRIRQSLETQTPVLDFSDLCLDQLPPELADCDHVHTLYLGPDLESEQWKEVERAIDWSINYVDQHSGSPDELFDKFPSIDNKFKDIQFLPRHLRHLYCWNNHLNTFRDFPRTLETLTWVGNHIPGLRELPPALLKLTLRCHSINKLENLPENLQSLELSGNQICKLENLPNNLQSLNLSNNQISKLENLPDSLQSLQLSNNQISKLENLPDSLQSLQLSNNQISKLENLPDSLQSLQLSNNQISKLENLPDSLQSLELFNNQINKLENLPENLQSLDLSYNQINKLENLPENLQLLDLSDNQISKIENLPEHLQSLYLWGNQISKIENLPDNLQSLYLWGNQISKLENLPENLQSLNLFNNQIGKLENLPENLQSLNLSDNPISKLENLPEHLQSLELSDNHIRKLENLPEHLQSLDLSGNQINKLENLPDNLQSLHLSNNQISKLENLPSSLQSLNLYKNQISKLENLPDNLQSLELSGNQISKLENLLDNLIALDLDQNKIQTIENLPEYLKHLSLRNNSIHHISVTVFPPGLVHSILSGNPVVNVPSEVLKGDRYHSNCLPDLKAWFADLELGAEKNKQLKLLISGNGNVGKSSVLEALKNGICTTETPSTHAISLDNWTLNDIQFRVWDFGGQEIFHGTHRLFLTAKAINLVVFDPVTEQQSLVPDRINPHELTRNHKITYWYNTIRELNPESPVIIAQNKSDEHQRDVAVAVFAAEQGCVFTEVSARRGDGIEVLKAQIADRTKEIFDYNMDMPASWLAVRRRLAENLALPPEAESRLRLCPTETFYTWCAEAKVLPASQEALLRYLHHTGNLYQNPQHLKDTLILDQMWALEGIYALLDRKSPFYRELRDDWKGKVRVTRLLEAWGTAYTLDEKRLFLGFFGKLWPVF